MSNARDMRANYNCPNCGSSKLFETDEPDTYKCQKCDFTVTEESSTDDTQDTKHDNPGGSTPGDLSFGWRQMANSCHIDARGHSQGERGNDGDRRSLHARATPQGGPKRGTPPLPPGTPGNPGNRGLKPSKYGTRFTPGGKYHPTRQIGHARVNGGGEQ